MEGSTFRVRTLFEAQYTSIHTNVNGPNEVNASGNAAPVSSAGTDWFVYPSFGLGAEKLFSKNFRWEACASGFILPHRSTIWDADTSFNYRRGRQEVVAGGEGFPFQTLPQRVEYVAATLPGAYVGVRWYLK